MTSADLIITNAQVHTMDGLTPHAQAIAVKDGNILAVGSSIEIKAMAGDGTKEIDAGGRLVFPGFQDTHVHLQDSGIQFSSGVSLRDAETLEQLQDMLRDWAAQTTDVLWVQGLCFNSALFTPANLTAEVLDAAVPDRPIYIMASDGHNAAINTRAMRELNITPETPNPNNGEICKSEDGQPNGYLYEDAIWWALGMLPKPTDDAYKAGVKYAVNHANSVGLTGVIDAMVGERHMRVYTELDNAGELNIRVSATNKVFPGEPLEEAVERLKSLRERMRSEKVQMHSAKFFLDGVMENGTAAMIDDYATGGNAPIMFDEDELLKLFKAFDKERFQIHAHTIGDKAIRLALDCIEAAQKENKPWPALHQLAHIQCINPADIPRFKELEVVANFQPYWACPEDSAEAAVELVGPERAKYIYAVNSVLKTGAPFAISSDWFVTTLNPFEIMEVAISRQLPGAKPGDPAFIPHEAITVKEVVKGYTTNAAAAAWRGQTTGSLSKGKFADIIIIDRDIFNSTPAEIGKTEVLLTLLGGKEVHRSENFPA